MFYKKIINYFVHHIFPKVYIPPRYQNIRCFGEIQKEGGGGLGLKNKFLSYNSVFLIFLILIAIARSAHIFFEGRFLGEEGTIFFKNAKNDENMIISKTWGSVSSGSPENIKDILLTLTVFHLFNSWLKF